VPSNCTHFTAKSTQKTFFTLIYVQKMYKFMANMLFMVLVFRMVFGSSVSRCFQQWYILWYKQMSLVVLFVLLVPYHGT